MNTLKELSVGDFVEGGVDEIVENLKEENPDMTVDYENIYSQANGYLAEITIQGRSVAVIDSLGGEPMVRELNEHNLMKLGGRP